MSQSEAERWNEKYRQESEFWLQLEPRQLLTSFVHRLPQKGRALDAACGVGINAVYLAKHGLKVFGIDISEVALRLANRRAKKMDLAIELVVADLSYPWLPSEFFDVITNFHFLERATIPVYRQALKRGGFILFDTFMATDNTIDTPEYYLLPGELGNLFYDFEIIHYSEELLEPGQSHGERGVVQLVARKPAVDQN
jgi:SAM-dependent methyltransferase